MRSRILFSALIYTLVGGLVLPQTNLSLVLADEPITSPITIPITTPITVSSIKITSPNGGESYKVGETMKISWTSNNLSQCIIKLAYEDGKLSTKWVPLNPSVGSYNWVIENQDLSGKDEQQVKVDMKCYNTIGNLYQDQSDDFFTIRDISIITPSPTPTPAPQSGNNSSNNSSSGSSGGGSAQAPVCGDSKPVSAPKLVYASATGRNQVTLVWSKALDPVSYYLVAYGTKPGQLEYGNPNVGGKDTISYVVKGLENGKMYYFKVRAGNGCMPGDFSNEVAVKATGDNINTGPAVGFKAGVLGSIQQEMPFKPITSANPTRVVTSSVNLFTKILNFFTHLFKR